MAKILKGVKIEELYYKRTRPGEPPIKYEARGRNNKVTSVVIHKDPVLKRHPKLERAMMSHEYNEIQLRHKGMLVKEAHKRAMAKESKLIRYKSLRQLWKLLK